MDKVRSAIEAVLFAAGECVPVDRLSLVLGVDREVILDTAASLAEEYEQSGRGIRLLFLNGSLQLCSAPEFSELISRTLETRKPAMLSQPALEVLAVIAYYQPVTRAIVERIRGVDCTFTLSSLLQKGLIEITGKLDAPGRPALYSTTDAFLRVMNISSLEQLPPLPAITDSEGIKKLQEQIQMLKMNETAEQLSITERKEVS